MYSNIQLKQKRLFGSREVYVNKNQDLTVISKSLFRMDEVPFSLDEIDPKPIVYRNLSVGNLVASVVLGIIFSGFLYGYFASRNDNAPVFMVFAVVVLILLLFPLKRLYASSRSFLIFTDKNTKSNLFVISPNKPSKKVVDDFVEQLRERIESVRYPENMSDDLKREVYNRHLIFLVHEGVITKEEYETIFDRTFNKKSADIFKLV